MGIEIPGTELSKMMYNEFVESGGAKDGTQGILKYYKKKFGVEFPKGERKQ